MSFPKAKPPHNIRVLHSWLRAYAGEHGQAEGRLKRSVDHAIVLTALHRAQDSAGRSLFVVKGGVAMELRLHLEARATRDLDAVFMGGFEKWLEALDDALEEPVADFTLSRGEAVEIRTTRTMRVDVYLDYRGRRWGTVTLEVAPAEEREILDVDGVQPFDLALFGLPRPETIPVVGLPYLIAQKLHACTEPFEDRENPRVRDLIDLQLVRPLVPRVDLWRVRDACVSIFAGRDTHPWPPRLEAPASWTSAYDRFAEESAAGVARDVDGAVQSINRFIEEIAGADGRYEAHGEAARPPLDRPSRSS